MDGEKVVSVATTGKLHAACLVGGIYHRQLPEESATLLVCVVTIAISHHWSVDTMSVERNESQTSLILAPKN